MWETCSENMYQIYSKTPMLKCDFNKIPLKFIEIALRHKCSPVNLLHIFRTYFYQSASRALPLEIQCYQFLLYYVPSLDLYRLPLSVSCY